MNTQGSQGSARILIVEDELLVRMFAVDALEEAGFEVAQAGDGAEALRALTAAQPAFTAVIIDLGLPDRSGEQLAGEIRAMHASMPIVIASGRSERELRDRFAGDRHIAILVKPYTSTLLLDSLESLGVTSAGR
jgi:DNA-binding response OmpR family regulator